MPAICQEESTPSLAVAVVIPTFNEAENVRTVVERLRHVLDSIEWEAIFVDDDSPDGTAAVVREISQTNRRVRVIQRIGRQGLASACIEGMLATSARYVAVMDADLQHDESILPAMLERIKADNLDLVIGSRHVAGGSVGDFTQGRAALSRLGSRLSHAVCKCELSDPMSGFFLLDRLFLDEVVHRLSGISFKILVDLIASARRPVRFAEIPYRFRQRERGTSKLDVNEGIEYLQLLLDKRIGQIVPSRFVMFSLVGALGLLVHLAVLALLYFEARYSFLVAQAEATMVAMTVNFLINNLTTFRDRRLHGWGIAKGLVIYYLACSIGALTNFSFARFLLSAGGPWYVAGVLGMAVSSVWNYGVNVIFTWKRHARQIMRQHEVASENTSRIAARITQ